MATPIMNSSISFSRVLSSVFLVSFFAILCSSNQGYALGGGESLDSHRQHTVQISSLLPSSVCSSSTKDNSKKGSLKLVHKHGACSRLNQDQANAPTATQILSRDQSRVNSIQYRVGLDVGQYDDLEGRKTTIPAKSGRTIGSGNYIVTVGLGTPKKDQSLIFDTGSDLTWAQCQPCVRYNISCGSTQCSQLTSATGNNPSCSTSTCVYGIQYGDSSFSVGYFATETLTLSKSDVFPNFLFGCGQNNQGLFGGAAGLLGLGRDQLSLVSQTASKFGKYFSYCLPTPSSTGYLSFGKSEAKSSSPKFTPLVPTSQSFYYFDITGIKLGGSTLSISQTVFKTAGSIIDSGTVITRLPPAAYSSLKTSFRQAMTKYPLTSSASILDTCYDLSNYTSVSIPTVSFLLGGGAEVPLDAQGILYAVKASQVCLAFAGNSAASDVGIFGNVQQQTLDVVYDVAGGKLGFGTGGCS
ncbi:hypothetical protein RHGRI_005742 [Rhododendron griersonianum]|uniref:Peptidase A1 domain-containing protein n=1 Tax=Rhododendron griersonianum TaxID=479676 RepID=A0AAV6LGR1_9ERIC|nr:hypothetical protein RHGRI_005742 [Rhododendron griersonianum]